MWWSKQSANQPVRIAQREHRLRWDDFSRDVVSVLKTLHQAGFEAYVVGGCLRDHLLGFKPKDYDVVTNAKPDEIKKLFKRSMKIGRRFPLVHVYFSRYHYVEVVTFRGPKKWWRKSAWGSIDTDALRRDFTINALYLKYPECELVDYTGGFEDLKQGWIRMIGDPVVRYQEDPVRALRALRFSAKLGLAIEAEAEHALADALPMLTEVSADRLYGEVLKAFYGGAGEKTFELLLKHNVLTLLLPGVVHPKMFRSQLGFIKLALKNADKRYMAGDSLSGAFLFAVLFWAAFQKKLRSYSRKAPLEQRIKRAAKSVVLRHQKHIAIPKRIYESVVSIWLFQYKWSQKDRADELIVHPRFRAAFDFLSLRNQAGENVEQWYQWWDQYIQNQPDPKRSMKED